MKKIFITFLGSFVLLAGVVQAQSLQDGISDLNARRYMGAKAVFEKLLAANPNNIDATYWLGQAYLEMDDVNGAKAVYEKALMASANAPLVIIGMGQVELEQNKISEARQRFEAAITMTRGKKGDDPVILNAVGRAITSAYDEVEKKGDINYAVEKLEAAVAKDPKNAEYYVNLGNALRKARPGENGGKAFEAYNKAKEANPSYPLSYYRLAQLFNSQRNYELYEQYLNQAIEKDPKFGPAYYDLYYLKLGKLDFTAAQEMATKYIANSDPDPQAEHFKAQTFWAEKKYDEAITISKDIISKSGAQTKPRTYVLLADAYLSKGDTAAAKPFIDEYFTKAKGDEITPVHWKMKADIYSGIPGMEDSVYAIYLNAVKADTVVSNKIDLLKKGIAFFASKKQYGSEAGLDELLLTIKPNLVINDYFNAGLANYRDSNYAKSYEIFTTVVQKFPEQEYGYEWMFNNAKVLDTVKVDSIALPAALKLLEFARKDTVKYARHIVNASYFIAIYYNTVKKDNAKAIEYLTMMKTATTDPAKVAMIEDNIKKLQQAPQRSTTPARPAPKPGGTK